MLNNYNRIAGIYSILSRLVFGSNLKRVQQILIKELPANGDLLILGGGNGDILKWIHLEKPDLNITYQEASSAMLKHSEKHVHPNQKVSFVHSDTFDLIPKHYTILCPFFLDLFSENQIESILKLSGKQTTWYVADFRLNNLTRFSFWRKLQIKLSIIFFRLTTSHSSQVLPDIRGTFHRLDYKSLFYKTLGSGFYCAEVFQPQP